ncbi:hypothetical protein OBBRIDRAFT_839184 [Obba rivulosa]|uniref:Uncharacterized protein n=1 Tax=Obba rivulosa TaxID=1052685 RepID=A0A8E2DFS6_9APHY|nr:hypothetical protein OBBRIDRAFT_839184 [Obba rivulosa]
MDRHPYVPARQAAPPVQLPSDLIERMRQALQKTEEELASTKLEKDALLVQVENLQLQLADARIASAGPAGSSKSTHKPSKDDSTPFYDDGKRFSFFERPWISPMEVRDFADGADPLALPSDDAGIKRLLRDGPNETVVRDCAIRDLRPFFNAVWTKKLEEPELQTLFREGIDIQRPSTISKARAAFKNAFRGQLDIDVDLLTTNSVKPTTGITSEFRRLAGWDVNTSRYKAFPPILYPNAQPDARGLRFFHNIRLAEMLRHLLFGHGGGRKPIGELWSVKSLTPGMIAFTAIAVTFILSPDITFAEKGGNSGIPYLQWFVWYKLTLELQRDKAGTQYIFTMWEDIVFRGRALRARSGSVPSALHDNDGEDFTPSLDAVPISDDSEDDSGPSSSRHPVAGTEQLSDGISARVPSESGMALPSSAGTPSNAITPLANAFVGDYAEPVQILRQVLVQPDSGAWGITNSQFG